MDATMQAALWISALQMIVQKIFKTVRRHRERAR